MLNGDPDHIPGLLAANVEGVGLHRDEDHIDIESWEAPSGVKRGDGFRQRLLLGGAESRGVGKNAPKRHLFVGSMIVWSGMLES